MTRFDPSVATLDELHMRSALEESLTVRADTAPNPWVGCRIVPDRGVRQTFEGSTAPPGGPHAEIAALGRAGGHARGATAYVTLEPCAHDGRTPPCADAMIAAGVRRVVVGVVDPDPRVQGRGIARLRSAGVEVTVGVCAGEIEAVLAPYLTQRRTGRPWVVLKLAATLDGRIAAPDGESRWITGAEARADAHRLRAESGAILVGAGTVRADNPRLTVRDRSGNSPLRVVLGAIPPGAAISPAISFSGSLEDLLDELGQREVLQLLVEGGARVAHDFHRAGLVDRYVLYLAPAFFGGDDAVAMFRGGGASTMASLWRGTCVGVERLGADLRLEIAPPAAVTARAS